MKKRTYERRPCFWCARHVSPKTGINFDGLGPLHPGYCELQATASVARFAYIGAPEQDAVIRRAALA
jgi:hypothetical protein